MGLWPRSAVSMPQPMSTPTRLGTTASATLIVVPMVQPMPKCASGMMAVFAPSANGMPSIVRICSTHAFSMFVA